MRKIASLIAIFISISTLNAQTIKVAILDFENTSGIAKYDGLGKAMSSMLITDIKANVSPKRLQLVERSQIQKILKEQKFQASSAADKTSSVKAGKLLGVKYLLVGDIYILNDVLVINARLTDTETGEIKLSKKQEGKLVAWLNLKTNIAKELATSLSLPLTQQINSDNGNSTESNETAEKISEESLINFSKALVKMDNNQLKEAEKYVKLCVDIPDKYILEIEKEISRNNYLKKFDFVISKIKKGNVSCDIVQDIIVCSNFRVENSVGNIKYNLYFIDEDSDVLGAKKFLSIKNNEFKDLGLDTMNTILEWQDFMFGRLLKYNEMLQVILSSPNIPANCSENIKEVSIGYWLTFFNDYTIVVSSRTKPERNKEMQDIYKNLYTKLLEINPNSSQLMFISYKNYKKRNDEYIVDFNNITNSK